MHENKYFLFLKLTVRAYFRMDRERALKKERKKERKKVTQKQRNNKTATCKLLEQAQKEEN